MRCLLFGVKPDTLVIEPAMVDLPRLPLREHVCPHDLRVGQESQETER